MVKEADLNPFAPDFSELPHDLPIFPLSGALLLPGGQLPLNIFEPRYLAMVEVAMAGVRYIGMVQPNDPDVCEVVDDTPVFEVGCAGKITHFEETSDGRYLITLTGICRFSIKEELGIERGFRRVKAGWEPYEADMEQHTCLGLDRERLDGLLKQYFTLQEMSCDWEAVADTPDERLITCLSMICPFSSGEKQALLEAQCCKTRAEMFMTMLEMAACADKDCGGRH